MTEQRILAIDYGEKRVGVAVTDPLNIFAYPLVTLPNNKDLIPNLKKVIIEYNVVKILLGMPYKESGAAGFISNLVLGFKGEIEKSLGLPVELVDERYSSEIARQRIIESVPSKKKRRDKGLLDKNAAAVILEDYLRSVGK